MGKSLEYPHVTLFSDIVFLKFVFNEKEFILFLGFALLCLVLCSVSSSPDSNPSATHPDTPGASHRRHHHHHPALPATSPAPHPARCACA